MSGVVHFDPRSNIVRRRGSPPWEFFFCSDLIFLFLLLILTLSDTTFGDTTLFSQFTTVSHLTGVSPLEQEGGQTVPVRPHISLPHNCGKLIGDISLRIYHRHYKFPIIRAEGVVTAHCIGWYVLSLGVYVYCAIWHPWVSSKSRLPHKIIGTYGSLRIIKIESIHHGTKQKPTVLSVTHSEGRGGESDSQACWILYRDRGSVLTDNS